MAEKHFFEQKIHSVNYLIPYFEKHIADFRKMRVLEVGCAEGGFMEELQNLGMDTVGLELLQSRVDIAREKSPTLNIICGDITDKNLKQKITSTFDLIVMRDTIEHVPDRKATFENISSLLNDKGFFYVTFPPRFSAFAGHQQNCTSILKAVPYLHFLPNFFLNSLGKLFSEKIMEGIALNYKIGLSIHKFESFYKRNGFTPVVKELFLSRPIFKVRYKIKTIRFPNIPILREFLAMGCEYLLQKN